MKNLFFLAVLKLDVKDSFGYNKEIERIGKTLKMEKPVLCGCFTWIVFIELNFTVAFLIRKTWDGRFTGKVGGWGILGNGKNPSNEGDDFQMEGGDGGGGDTPLWSMRWI